MRRVFAIGVVAAALCGQAHAVVDTAPFGRAAAPRPGVAAPTRVARVAIDPGEVVCRVETRPGSRIGADRVCLTRAQWTAVARRSAVWLEGIQSTPDSAPIP